MKIMVLTSDGNVAYVGRKMATALTQKNAISNYLIHSTHARSNLRYHLIYIDTTSSSRVLVCEQPASRDLNQIHVKLFADRITGSIRSIHILQ